MAGASKMSVANRADSSKTSANITGAITANNQVVDSYLFSNLTNMKTMTGGSACNETSHATVNWNLSEDGDQ